MPDQSQQSQFDPKQFGAVPVAAPKSSQGVFNPSDFGATAVTQTASPTAGPTATPYHPEAAMSAANPSLWQRFKDVLGAGAPQGSVVANATGNVGTTAEPRLLSPEAAMTTVEQRQHPVLTGLGQVAGGLTTPTSALTIAGTGGMGAMTGTAGKLIPRLVSGYFSEEMLRGAYNQRGDLKAAMDRGDSSEAQRLITTMTAGGLMGYAAGVHALGAGMPDTLGNLPKGDYQLQGPDRRPSPTSTSSAMGTGPIVDVKGRVVPDATPSDVAIKPAAATTSETGKHATPPKTPVAVEAATKPIEIPTALKTSSTTAEDLDESTAANNIRLVQRDIAAGKTPQEAIAALRATDMPGGSGLATVGAPKLPESVQVSVDKSVVPTRPSDPTGSMPMSLQEAAKGLGVRYGALPVGAEPATYYDKMTQHGRDFEAAKAMLPGPERETAMSNLREAVDKTKSDRAVNKLFDDYTDAALAQQIDPRTSSENPRTRALMSKELAARRAGDALQPTNVPKIPDIASVQATLKQFSKASDDAAMLRAGKDFKRLIGQHMRPDADPDAREAVSEHLDLVHQTVSKTLDTAQKIMDAKPAVDESKAFTTGPKPGEFWQPVGDSYKPAELGQHDSRVLEHMLRGNSLELKPNVYNQDSMTAGERKALADRSTVQAIAENRQFSDRVQAELTSQFEDIRNNPELLTDDKREELKGFITNIETALDSKFTYKGKGGPEAVLPQGNRDFWNQFFGKPKGYKASSVIPSGPTDARYLARVQQLQNVAELARRGSESLKSYGSEGAARPLEISKTSPATPVAKAAKAPSPSKAIETVRQTAWTAPAKPSEIPGKAWIKSFGDSKTEYSWKSIDVPKTSETPIKGMSSEQWEAYKADKRGELGAVSIPQAVHDLGDEVKAIAGRMNATASEISTSLRNAFVPTAGVDRDTMEVLDAYKGGEEKDKFLANATLDSYSHYIGKLNDTDRLEVMSKIMRGDLQDTPELRQFAEDVRIMDDKNGERKNAALNRRAGTTAQDILNIIKDHYRIIWDKPPGHDEANYNAWAASRRPMQGSKGSLKMRTYDDILDGMDPAKTGGKPGIPITTNPIEMFKLSNLDDARFIHAMNYFADGRDAGRAKFVKTGARLNAGQSIIPKEFEVYFPAASGEGLVRAGQWSMPDDEVRLMSNYLSPDFIRSNILGRAVMDYKNVATGIKLLGPFHAASMIGKSIAMDIGRGTTQIANLGVRGGNPDSVVDGLTKLLKAVSSPVTAYKEGTQFRDMARFRSVASSWLKSTDGLELLNKFPNAPDMLPRMMAAGARLDVGEEYKIDIRKAFANTVAKIRPDFDAKNRLTGLYHVVKAGVQGVLIPLEAPLQAMFNKYIPMLKLGQLARQMQINDEMYAPRLISGEMSQYESDRQAVSYVDNVLGQLNMSNLWHKRTTTTALQLLYNSPGWRMGTTKQFGESFVGQVKEILAANRASKSLPNSATIGERFKANTPMLHPKMAYWLGEAAVAVTIAALGTRFMTGKNPTSREDLLHMNTGEVDQRGKPIRLNTPFYISNDIPQLLDNGFKGPFQYATSGISSPVQGVIEQYRNKDFSGQIIRDPNDTVFQQAISTVRAAIPIPIGVQTFQRLRGTGSKATWASALGLSTARYDIDMTPAEKLAAQSVSDERGSTPKTARQMQTFAAKDKIFAAHRSGDQPRAAAAEGEAIQAGLIKPSDRFKIRQEAKTSVLVKDVNEISPEAAYRVYQAATLEERQQLLPILLHKRSNFSNYPMERRQSLAKLYSNLSVK